MIKLDQRRHVVTTLYVLHSLHTTISYRNNRFPNCTVHTNLSVGAPPHTDFLVVRPYFPSTVLYIYESVWRSSAHTLVVFLIRPYSPSTVLYIRACLEELRPYTCSFPDPPIFPSWFTIYIIWGNLKAEKPQLQAIVGT